MPGAWTWFPAAFYALCGVGVALAVAHVVLAWRFLHDAARAVAP
jgi:hypothetical protein